MHEHLWRRTEGGGGDAAATSGTTAAAATPKLSHSELNVLKTMIVIVVCFVLCWSVQSFAFLLNAVEVSETNPYHVIQLSRAAMHAWAFLAVHVVKSLRKTRAHGRRSVGGQGDIPLLFEVEGTPCVLSPLLFGSIHCYLKNSLF